MKGEENERKKWKHKNRMKERRKKTEEKHRNKV
jgi:hypothetical protein